MNELKQTLSTFWNERDQRERNMLIAAIVVIMAALYYMLFIDPALTGRRDLDKQLPVLRQQAAEMRAMSKDVAALSAKTTAPVPALTRESLEASLVGKGLKSQNLSLTGDLAKVQLNSVSFAAMVDWLDEMQRSARVSVLDAKVDALPQADTVNATLTLRQQRSEQTQ